MPPLPVPDGTDMLDIEVVYVLQWFARNGRTYIGFYLDIDKYRGAIEKAHDKGVPIRAYQARLNWEALPCAPRSSSPPCAWPCGRSRSP